VSAREGGALGQPDVPRPYVKRHVFASDGRSLLATYFGEPGGGGDFWPILGGRLGDPQHLPGPVVHNDPADAAAVPGGGFIVLSTDRVRFFTANGRLMRPDVAIAGPMRVAVSDDGSRIAVAAVEGLVMFDRSGKRLVDRPFAELGAPAATVALSDGREFVAISAEGIARFFGRDGQPSRPPIELWAHDSLSNDWYGTRVRLLSSPNGRVFALLAPTGRIELFDQTFARIGSPFSFATDARPAKTISLADDHILQPLPQGSGFSVVAFDGRAIGRIDLSVPPRGEPQAAAAAAGTVATWSWDNRLRLWSSEGKLLAERPIEPIGPMDLMSMSADGRRVVLHDAPNFGTRLVAWWPQSDRLEELEGEFVRFLPDNRLVRFGKGRLWIGEASVEIDADQVHAVTDDGATAIVSKGGVARVVAIPH
jgi:hypothetical protein